MQLGNLSDSQPETWGTSLPEFFEIMPNSLWLEDYSQLYDLFENWRSQGITDLRDYLAEDATRVAQCSACIKVLHVNRKTLDMFNAASFDELSSRLNEVLRDDMLEAHIGELEQLWAGNDRFESKSVNYTLNGERLDVLIRAVILPDHKKRWDRVLVSLDNITELENAHRRVLASEQYARGIFEYAPVSLWVEDFHRIKILLEEVRERGITDFRTFTDVHPDFVEQCMSEIKVLDVNQYTIDMFKAKNKQDLLTRLPEVFRDDMRDHFREQLIDLWDGKLFMQREVLNYGLDGNPLNIHLQFSVFNGHEKHWDLVLLALTDITARKKAEAYLEYLGKHDVLTKLKNRSFYVDEISRLDRKGPFPVTVIIIDINNLKTINDTLGHAAGDDLLRRAGEILGQLNSKGVTTMRIGGDEFAVFMPGATDEARTNLLANLKKLTDLNNQFYNGPFLQLAAGWSICEEGKRLEDALREADHLMYEEKRKFYAMQASDDDASRQSTLINSPKRRS
tara:strand:- start:21027 stop:22550 length:1524 start_codon:yes stop_codon:yes gene_type:complete